MRRLALILTLCLIARGFCRDGLADQSSPTTQPDAGFVVSDMRVQTVGGFNFLYDTSQTSLAKIDDPVGRMVPALNKAIADGKFRPAGPLVLVYHDMSMRQPFTLDIGFMVPPETAAFDQFKVRQEDSFKCATVLFSGPLTKISGAYAKVFAALGAAGLSPTAINREVYLYWEGRESPNNVIQIQIGIQ
jgi:hypothetical protein